MSDRHPSDGQSAARTLRIVQISDTHLSGARAYALGNVVASLEAIAADPPDLVVHTGDVCADDPDDAEERNFAATVVRDALRGIPLVSVPGNHDVGGFTGDLTTAQRIEAFRAVWGDDEFDLVLGGWRLLGIDGYRLGGHPPLAPAVPGQPVAVFTHQPPHLDAPDLADPGDWSLGVSDRAAFWALLAGFDVRFVASGHLHRWRLDDRRRPWLVHCPSAAFSGTGDPRLWSDSVGIAEHLLEPDGTHRHRLVEPPGVTPLAWRTIAGGAHSMRELPLLPAERR